jgi:hypothetical protein
MMVMVMFRVMIVRVIPFDGAQSEQMILDSQKELDKISSARVEGGCVLVLVFVIVLVSVFVIVPASVFV